MVKLGSHRTKYEPEVETCDVGVFNVLDTGLKWLLCCSQSIGTAIILQCHAAYPKNWQPVN